ncbi:MAG: ATP cone domain-containing protein [Patescibacteria group bacterium]
MFVLKAGGTREFFNKKKIASSLVKIGMDKEWAKGVADEIRAGFKRKTVSSDEIFDLVLEKLKPFGNVYLGKYNLRRAVMDLGPTGYPFEKYIARVLEEYGYQAKTNQFIDGFCVRHEIDVLAEKDKSHFIVECKYHNTRGARSDLKVALALWARWLDIQRKWEKEAWHPEKYHGVWLITNTKCTSEAIKYAECVEMLITSWGYPGEMSLEKLIYKKQLYPVNIFPGKEYQRFYYRLGQERIYLSRDLLKHSAKELAKMLNAKELETQNWLDRARELVNHE